MLCPHCNTGIELSTSDRIYPSREKNSESLGIKLSEGFCPVCGKLIVILQRGTYRWIDGEAELLDITEQEILFPKFNLRSLHVEIPEKYRSAFNEANAVLSLSPKASAALSRRLLQQLLRDEFNITGKVDLREEIRSDAPVRVLVGHKGIGKSALFQVAMAEEKENGRLTVSIQPNDILNLALDNVSFLHLIMSWTNGLNEIIIRKIFDFIGLRDKSLISELPNYEGNLLEFLNDVFRTLEGEYTPSKKHFIETFLKEARISVYIDDLDRGWQGRKEDVTRISALINAARDISSKNWGVNFKIALRSDVYYLVRTSDESTDKVEG